MHKRKEIPFEKYNFRRKQFKAKDLPYLMGNNEMGGLAHLSGLGFEKLFFTDVWDTEKSRMGLPGPLLIHENINPGDMETGDFENELTLKEGILTTQVTLNDQTGYKSEIFFSKSNRHLLCMKITPKPGMKGEWKLVLPGRDFILKPHSKGLKGEHTQTESFSEISWAISSNSELSVDPDNNVKLHAGQNEDIELYYSVTTQFDGDNFTFQSEDYVNNCGGFDALKQELIHFSEKEFRSIASIILPEGEHAKWFYRAIFALYNTSGAKHFLPAELQFSKPSPHWNGHPFTYGQGGWGVFAFTFLGAFDKAENMAKWHYNPEVLKENVHRMFPDKGEIDVYFKDEYKGKHHYIDDNEKNAISFGHELTAEGYNIPISHTLGKYTMHWDWQMHLNSFAASFFHTLSRYANKPELKKTLSYPVLKGTAELWCALLNWDEERKFWYLPPLLSVSENILEKSVLDAIIGARWNLLVAASYARNLHQDLVLAEKWTNVADNIYIPENDTNYLEYLDDDEKREGGGYFGIRAPMALAFPYLEALEKIDRQKARITLDKAWKRNKEGHGMIAYVANWFALTESYLGYNDKAYQMASLIFKNVDPSDAAICEAYEYEDNDNKKGDWIPKFPYYLTGYSAFICSTISFLIQSFNGQIRVFPCLPKHWKDIEIYDLPCEGGFTVSAELKDGKVKWIEIKKDHKIILETNSHKTFKINENKEIEIHEE